MSVIERHQPGRHRTIFLSDIHLGTRGCQAELLLDFLKKNECDNLYLVGDIVDGWRLKRWWYWPQAHNDVVQKIMRKARKGTNVVYIPGNHDEAARQYCQLTFGDVRVEEEAIHVQPDGKKLLVIHGDQFDGIVAGSPAMRTGRSNLGLVWMNYLLTQIAPKGADGKPEPNKVFSASERKLVTDAIVASCDAKDGLKDGMIFNTRQCSFDPAALACKGGKTDACLAPEKVDALAKGMAGPKNSRGAQSYPPFPWDSGLGAENVAIDRKSTRLNSSHT